MITNGSHTSHVCVCAIRWWCDDVVKSWSDDYKRIACVVCMCVCDRVMMRWCCKILEWWIQSGWWCDDVVKSWSDEYKRIACVVWVCVCVCVCVCVFARVMMRWCCKILEWWLQAHRIRRMYVCAIRWWCDDVVTSWSDDYKRIACVACACVRSADDAMML